MPLPQMFLRELRRLLIFFFHILIRHFIIPISHLRIEIQQFTVIFFKIFIELWVFFGEF